MGCLGFLARDAVAACIEGGDDGDDVVAAAVFGDAAVLSAEFVLLDGTGDRRAPVAAENVSTASAMGAGIRGKTVSLCEAIVHKSAGHADVWMKKL